MKNTFGKTKNNILAKIIDSYENKNMNSIKKIIKLIKENTHFSNMYVLYEEIENKYFDDIEIAKYYVDELSKKLNGTEKNFIKTCQTINENININSENNELYDSLDTLMEEDSLFNIDKKIKSKLFLINHLTKHKEIVEENKTRYTKNETLLNTLLSNDFNSFYGKTLSEDDKKTLKNIINLNNDELKNKIQELTETINNKIDTLLNESVDDELKIKLEKVREQILTPKVSKLNYYKLIELKNGLD